MKYELLQPKMRIFQEIMNVLYLYYTKMICSKLHLNPILRQLKRAEHDTCIVSGKINQSQIEH